MKLKASVMAIAMAAVITTGAAANGAPAVIGLPNDVAIEQLNTGRDIELTLQYPSPNPYNEPAEGERGADQLGGIEFLIERVNNIDLTTAEGWARAAQIDDINDVDEFGLTEVGTYTTDSEGKITVTLPIGLYLISELPNDDSFAIADGFLIALPVADEKGDRWAYRIEKTLKVNLEPFDPQDVPTPTPTPPTTPPTTVPPTVPPLVPPIIPPITPPVTTPSTAVTTTPSRPGSTPTTTPRVPGQPSSPGQPRVTGTPTPTNRTPLPLPNTGAQVIGIALAAIVLIGLGFGLMIIGRRKTNEGKEQ